MLNVIKSYVNCVKDYSFCHVIQSNWIWLFLKKRFGILKICCNINVLSQADAM